MRSGPDIGGQMLGVGDPNDPGNPWMEPQSISWGYRGLGDSLTATAPRRSNSVYSDLVHGLITALRRRVLGSLELYLGN